MFEARIYLEKKLYCVVELGEDKEVANQKFDKLCKFHRENSGGKAIRLVMLQVICEGVYEQPSPDTGGCSTAESR